MCDNQVHYNKWKINEFIIVIIICTVFEGFRISQSFQQRVRLENLRLDAYITGTVSRSWSDIGQVSQHLLGCFRLSSCMQIENVYLKIIHFEESKFVYWTSGFAADEHALVLPVAAKLLQGCRSRYEYMGVNCRRFASASWQGSSNLFNVKFITPSYHWLKLWFEPAQDCKYWAFQKD